MSQHFAPPTLKTYHLGGISYEVSSKYVPQQNLGSGAYGSVCMARDLETNSKVAIKKIKDAFANPTYAKRTLREIQILAHFNHPNVVKLVEVLPYATQRTKKIRHATFVMEFMDTDLNKIIYSHNKLTSDHWKYFMIQILNALKHIHDAGIMHRDIKPANILVDSNCSIKLCDFGLACSFLDKSEPLEEYVVTRWYRPPEILCNAKTYGPGVDLWAAGCIFAEMICKRTLFPGKNATDQIFLIIRDLGYPSFEDLSWITNPRALNYVHTLTRFSGRRNVLHGLSPSADNEAVDLLSKMLMWNPHKRISVDEAFKHPYLDAYRETIQVMEPEIFPYEYEQGLSTTRSVKKVFLATTCKPDSIIASCRERLMHNDGLHVAGDANAIFAN